MINYRVSAFGGLFEPLMKQNLAAKIGKIYRNGHFDQIWDLRWLFFKNNLKDIFIYYMLGYCYHLLIYLF